MALAVGDSPFGPRRSGGFNFDTSVLQPHTLYVEDCPKRVRGVLADETVVDSTRVKRLHETGILPVYYFPVTDVKQEWLIPTDHATHCPFKGDARYWTLQGGGRSVRNAVWNYPEPLPSSPLPADYVAFQWGAMDAWFEEDDRIIGHPHDPYHRVDVNHSSRHVRIMADGLLIAETRRPKLVFETSLPTRYYLPKEDVRMDRLAESDTHTTCPYKGIASYWSVRTDEGTLADVAWEYPDPLPEAQILPGTICFLGAGIEILVDGEPQS